MIPPASTGRDSRSRIAVSNTLHTNSGISSYVKPFGRIFQIVVMKLAAPRILLTPAICREKIPRSTLAPG